MSKETDKADKAEASEESASQSKDPGETEPKPAAEDAETDPKTREPKPVQAAAAKPRSAAAKGNGAGPSKAVTGKVETNPRRLKAKSGGKSGRSAKTKDGRSRGKTDKPDSRSAGEDGNGGQAPSTTGSTAQANGAADTPQAADAKQPRRSRARGAGSKRSDSPEQGSLDLPAPERNEEAVNAEKKLPPAPKAAGGRGKASKKKPEAAAVERSEPEPVAPQAATEPSEVKPAAEKEKDKPKTEKLNADQALPQEATPVEAPSKGAQPDEAPADEAKAEDEAAAAPTVAQEARLASLTAEDRPPDTWSRGSSRAWMLMLVLLLIIAGGLGWLYWDMGREPEGQAPQGAMTERDLRELEELLARLDFAPGRIDGVVDDKTRQAITAYQQAAGLPIDGEPTAALLSELREVTRLMKTGG